MITRSAGKWTIEVSGPHPMWSKISYGDAQYIMNVHHADLRDLTFILDRAVNAIREKLGTNEKHELD